MVVRHRQEETVVPEHLGIDSWPRRNRSADAEVDLTVDQRSGLLVGGERVEFHLGFRPGGPKAAEEGRNEFVRRRVNETEPKPTTCTDPEFFRSPPDAVRGDKQ